MIIRNIENHEIENFVQSYEYKGFQNWINRYLETNETKPEWCFVAEENGEQKGQLIYFSFDGNESEMNLVGFELPWEGNYLEIGEKLLRESLEKIRNEKIKKIEFRFDTGDEYHQKMKKLFERVGYTLIQDKYRLELTNFDIIHDYNHEFIFKTLYEIGEEEFIKAIKAVTVHTLDRQDKNDIDIVGAEESASEYFNILKSIDYNPDNWVLAYDKDNNLIGLVVAQNLTEKVGCINYIGVIPEQRGHNYSRDLAIKTTELLRNMASPMEKIIADIDTQNFPLKKTLSSLNYKETKKMWVYHKYL